jgi:Asp-tRNA(Asn)/Glu-tRNA(Gln) amidotransferase A subunit family amidase
MSSKKAHDLTITEAASAISAGDLTPTQLVASCLERIDAVEGSIRAWALVDREGALKAAESLDEELRRGQRRGALHGIPFGIKDIFYTAGLPTEAGSRSWSGFVPSYDATSVGRLKEAGAIILGKTHTTEFAYMDPAPTRNPWNTGHTPGGSSSGSGAGVAAGMCLAALGSQTLGSVLRPAAYNGIVGFKPQHGRISTYGVVPLSPTLDHVGILARSVADTALIFQTIAGQDPMDHYSLDEPVPDTLGPLQSQVFPRMGLVKDFFFDNADDEMRSHTEEVVERLRQAGAQVEEVGLPPSFATIIDNARIILAVEAAAYHEDHRRRIKHASSRLREGAADAKPAVRRGHAAAPPVQRSAHPRHTGTGAQGAGIHREPGYAGTVDYYGGAFYQPAHRTESERAPAGHTAGRAPHG